MELPGVSLDTGPVVVGGYSTVEPGPEGTSVDMKVAVVSMLDPGGGYGTLEPGGGGNSTDELPPPELEDG